jgi:hypothetical protein
MFRPKIYQLKMFRAVQTAQSQKARIVESKRKFRFQSSKKAVPMLLSYLKNSRLPKVKPARPVKMQNSHPARLNPVKRSAAAQMPPVMSVAQGRRQPEIKLTAAFGLSQGRRSFQLLPLPGPAQTAEPVIRLAEAAVMSGPKVAPTRARTVARKEALKFARTVALKVKLKAAVNGVQVKKTLWARSVHIPRVRPVTPVPLAALLALLPPPMPELAVGAIPVLLTTLPALQAGLTQMQILRLHCRKVKAAIKNAKKASAR